jgi:hypothetical protein
VNKQAMKKPLILQIPQPCSESWAEMKPMGLGRFCTHCQKTVTDITQMSDAQVSLLFQKNTDTHCIRAFASQLNRLIALPPQPPNRFYRIVVALGLYLVVAAAADTYARPRPPLVEQNYLLDADDSTQKETIAGDTLKIRGVVLDEEGYPFPGVVVKLKKEGLTKGGTITDDNGNFNVQSNTDVENINNVYLETSTLGYGQVILFVKKDFNPNEEVSIKLKVDNTKLQGDLIITKGEYAKKPKRRTKGY